MIETEFTFFEVEAQGGSVEAAKLGQAHFGDAPEVLDAVDVRLAFDELVAAMIDPVMFLVAEIQQAAVTPSSHLNKSPCPRRPCPSKWPSTQGGNSLARSGCILCRGV